MMLIRIKMTNGTVRIRDQLWGKILIMTNPLNKKVLIMIALGEVHIRSII